MSRHSSDPAATPSDALTILHWTDGAWRRLHFRRAAQGIEILEADSLDPQTAREICAAAAPNTVRIVVPAEATLTRTIMLGHGDPATLEHQLAQEAHEAFDDSVPLHRIAVAMQPGKNDDQQFGVAVAWPLERSIQLPMAESQDLLAIPDVIGLLALLGDARPDLPLIWHDRNEGSAALVLAGLGRATARTTRLDSGDEASIRRFVLESALQAGWSPDESRSLGDGLELNQSADIGLALPESVQQNLKQRCPQAAQLEWRHFGIALGCALAATGELATASALRPSLPEITPTRTEQAIDHLSERRTAIGLVAALIVVVILGPIIISGLQLAILRITTGDLNTVVDQAAMVEQRQQLYGQLSSSSIPVTKLISDIAAATPLGVKLDSIRMASGEPVRVGGSATAFDGQSAADLIANMKDLMQVSGVFRDVSVEWGARSNLGEREFTMSASVSRPTYRPRYSEDQDFAAWTLQQRRHKLPKTSDGGPDPRPSLAAKWVPVHPDEAAASAKPPATTTASAPSANDSGSSSSSPRPATTRPSLPAAPTTPITTPSIATGPSSGGGKPSNGVSVFSGGSSLGGSSTASDTGSLSVSDSNVLSGDLSAGDMGAVPEILTDEQIATLTRAETKAKINSVSAARSRNLDPETDAALKDYFRRLFTHLRSLPREDEP
ncbi:MAG: hypothetical protein MK077_07805 [Phycisphaerales bacterium]|nr:hypothetical protein [Phycisphaerales bacterium]